MVVIAYRGDLNAAFWVDGFLPERAKIERVYSSRFPEQPLASRNDAEQIYTRSTDEMVAALLDDTHNKHEKKYGCKYSYLYLHHNYGIAPNVSALIDELEEKSSIPSRKEYRQIVTVCDLEDEKRIRKCTTEMATQIGLEIRKDYKAIESFTRSVHGLLELVIEPFVAPKASAARQLPQFGLERL